MARVGLLSKIPLPNAAVGESYSLHDQLLPDCTVEPYLSDPKIQTPIALYGADGDIGEARGSINSSKESKFSIASDRHPPHHFSDSKGKRRRIEGSDIKKPAEPTEISIDSDTEFGSKEEEYENLDERNPKRRRSDQVGSGSNHDRSISCPFYRLDPVNFGRCVKYEMKRVKDVKQHLFRVHFRSSSPPPMRSCPRKDCQNRRKKGPEAIRLPPDGPPGYISKEQKERLAALSVARGMTGGAAETHGWFEIWEILFPDRSRPSTQRVFVGNAVQEAVFVLESVWRSNKESLLSDIVDTTSTPVAGENLQRYRRSARSRSSSIRETAANSITALFSRLGTGSLGRHEIYNQLAVSSHQPPYFSSHESLDTGGTTSLSNRWFGEERSSSKGTVTGSQLGMFIDQPHYSYPGLQHSTWLPPSLDANALQHFGAWAWNASDETLLEDIDHEFASPSTHTPTLDTTLSFPLVAEHSLPDESARSHYLPFIAPSYMNNTDVSPCMLNLHP